MASDTTIDPASGKNEFQRHFPKTARLIEKLESEKGKHFVYTAFNKTCEGDNVYYMGAQAIGKALEARAGYVRVYPDELKAAMDAHKAKSDGSLRDALVSAIRDHKIRSEIKPATKFYAVFVKRELTDRATVTSGKAKSSDDGASSKASDAIREFYNHAQNADGRVLHVLIASETYNEGLDLAAVRHLHFMEPFATQPADVQAVGRARRNCSHKQIPDRSMRDVTVHRYEAVLPKGTTFQGLLNKPAGRGKKDDAASAHAAPTGRVDGIEVPTGSHERDTLDQVVLHATKAAAGAQKVFFKMVKGRSIDCWMLEGFHKLDNNSNSNGNNKGGFAGFRCLPAYAVNGPIVVPDRDQNGRRINAPPPPPPAAAPSGGGQQPSAKASSWHTAGASFSRRGGATQAASAIASRSTASSSRRANVSFGEVVSRGQAAPSVGMRANNAPTSGRSGTSRTWNRSQVSPPIVVSREQWEIWKVLDAIKRRWRTR
jgi:hypothetical protein